MSKVYEAYMKELERSYEYDEAYYWYQLAQKEQAKKNNIKAFNVKQWQTTNGTHNITTKACGICKWQDIL